MHNIKYIYIYVYISDKADLTKKKKTNTPMKKKEILKLAEYCKRGRAIGNNELSWLPFDGKHGLLEGSERLLFDEQNRDLTSGMLLFVLCASSQSMHCSFSVVDA